MATATFGGGCFWCIDAAFRELSGVTDVTSGYMGGHTDNPNYQAICTGETGHAEVIQITYDENQLPFSTLLDVFFTLHDPTQLNRQGNDVGTQYRSVVFYHSNQQKLDTEIAIRNLAGHFQDPIVTELAPVTTFYPAEYYHQDYYSNNTNQPYCSYLITPKMVRFRERFKALIDQ